MGMEGMRGSDRAAAVAFIVCAGLFCGWGLAWCS